MYYILDVAVTIISSPKLGVDTVCDNQDVTLTCHTDQTIGNMITWYWYNQSQHGDTITVVATMTEVAYTCVGYNQGKKIGRANVTVRASGEWKISYIINYFVGSVLLLNYIRRVSQG